MVDNKISKSKPNGRPSSYRDETGVEICTRMLQGQSLRTICKDSHMPDMSTIFRWLKHDEGFYKQYMRAREERCYAYAEDIVQIPRDLRDIKDLSNEDIQRARLEVDSLKWVAVKYLPKVFGDRVEHEHSGTAIQVNILQKLGDGGADTKTIEVADSKTKKLE